MDFKQSVVDLGVMVMKGHSTLPRALELESHSSKPQWVMPRIPFFRE